MQGILAATSKSKTNLFHLVVDGKKHMLPYSMFSRPHLLNQSRTSNGEYNFLSYVKYLTKFSLFGIETTSRPPGLSTRAASRMPESGSGKYWKTRELTTASKLSSSSGSLVMSAQTRSILHSFVPGLTRKVSNMGRVKSTPTSCSEGTLSTKSSVILPWPHPRSTTLESLAIRASLIKFSAVVLADELSLLEVLIY